MIDLYAVPTDDIIDHLRGLGLSVIGPVGPALVDCGCTVTVYSDGSGVEVHYCALHRAAPNLLAACRATQEAQRLYTKAAAAHQENAEAIAQGDEPPHDYSARVEEWLAAVQTARQLCDAAVVEATGYAGLTPTPPPKDHEDGYCPTCSRKVPMVDGRLMAHMRLVGETCPGTGGPPTTEPPAHRQTSPSRRS